MAVGRVLPCAVFHHPSAMVPPAPAEMGTAAPYMMAVPVVFPRSVLRMAVSFMVAAAVRAIRMLPVIGPLAPLQIREFFFHIHDNLDEQFTQLLPFFAGESAEKSIRAFPAFFAEVGGSGLALIGGGYDDVAPVGLVPFAGDESVALELAQQLAQGCGPYPEAGHQIALVHESPLIKNGEDMPLRVLGVPLAVIGAGHEMGRPPEQLDQCLIGYWGEIGLYGFVHCVSS